MSVRIISFNEISVPEGMLFDRVTIELRFKTNKLLICSAKSHEFEYIKNNSVYRKNICARIRIPPTFFQCFLYIHASIINMKTMTEVLEIRVDQNDQLFDAKNLLIQTQLGPFLLNVRHQQEKYIANEIDSEISSSTMTIQNIGNTQQLESQVQQYAYNFKQQLTESESKQKKEMNEGEFNNLIKIKRNHAHFLSDGNFDSTRTG